VLWARRTLRAILAGGWPILWLLACYASGLVRSWLRSRHTVLGASL
jgi:hypothetical protein